MTASIPSGTSGVGTAPQAAGTAPTTSAGAGATLPQLVPQAGTGVGVPTAPTAGTPGAAAPAAPGPDITALAAKGRWLGPLLAIGGGAAALAASRGAGGSSLLKFAGISSALSGVALTGVGFKAHGITTGKAAAEAEFIPQVQAYEQQVSAQVAAMQQQYEQTIATLQQRIATSGSGAGDGAPSTPGAPSGPTGSGAGTVPNSPIPTSPTAPVPTAPGSATPGGTTGGTAPIVDLPASAPTTGVSPAAALVGRTLQLPAGGGVAAAGTFRIGGVIGDGAGYATADEAMTAAAATMSIETMGSKFVRWVTIEREGRFYAAVAQDADQSTGSGTALAASDGTLVGWTALNHISRGSTTDGWRAYSWTRDGGAREVAVPYGGDVAASLRGATTPAGSAPVGAPASTTGGGASPTFDPASVVGRTFSVNAATTEDGTPVRGGVVQLRGMVAESTGGFATAEEAAPVARSARSTSAADPWARTVTVGGGDGRFYVFSASLVARATQPLQGAAPVHVFGAGVAEYYDGAAGAWRAVADAA